ncbi:hypothetical protein CLF_108236, partial [Clonorchis sinensis]
MVNRKQSSKPLKDCLMSNFATRREKRDINVNSFLVFKSRNRQVRHTKAKYFPVRRFQNFQPIFRPTKEDKLHENSNAVATIFEISRYTYISNVLLIRLLKILRQPTTGFALPLRAHQVSGAITATEFDFRSLTALPNDERITLAARTARIPFKARVELMLIFVKIGQVDTVNERYQADIFLQARWREPLLDATWNTSRPRNNFRTFKMVENPVMELAPKRHLHTLKLQDDEFWNPRLLLDNAQGEPIEIVSHEVEFVEPDFEAYLVEKRRIKGGSSPGTCKRRHPGLVFTSRSARRAGYFMVNMALISCVLSLLSFSVFSVPVDGNRLQLSLLLLLTTVTFKFAASQNLPKISYLTYLDKMVLANFFMLVILTVWHTIARSVFAKYPGLKDKEQYVVYTLLSAYCLGAVVFGLTVYLD